MFRAVLTFVLLLFFLTAAGQKKVYFLRDTSVITEKLAPSEAQKHVLNLTETETRTPFFSDSLKTSGYVSRTLSSGSNRDFSQNTVSDFKAEAEIAGGIRIAAEVQDFDMPVDETGVTEQVSELSSFKITVSKDSSGFAFGDIAAEKQNSDFLCFSKKIRGVSFFSNGKEVSSDVLFSQTKGQTVRQEFFGRDNSQGLYYLTAFSDSSVTVLTGTEKIWLDGTLLSRESDYVIDYNGATIEFAAKHVITSQSRIVAEFEYAENTGGYFLYADAGFRRGQNAFSVAYLSEFESSDKKNRKDYVDFQTEFSPLKNSCVRLETAFSKRSFAGSVNVAKTFFASDSLKTLKLFGGVKFLSDSFSTVMSDKPADFGELWGISNYEKKSREIFYDAGFSAGYKKFSSNYKIVFADIKDYMRGCGNSFDVRYNGQQNVSALKIDCFQRDSLYRHFAADFSTVFFFKPFNIGFNFKGKNSQPDSINLSFRDFSIFLEKKYKNSNAKFSATDRKNGGGFLRYLTLEFLSEKKDFYKINALQILKTVKNNSESINALSGFIGGFVSLFDRQLTLSANYKSDLGTAEKMSFKFLKTTPGNGYFTWIDYNGDGKEDLNEFEKSYYKSDANYVKYFVHSGEFVNTTDRHSDFSIRFNGKKNNKKISFFLSRLNIFLSLENSAKKSFSDSLINRSFQQRYESKILIFKELYVGNRYFSSFRDMLTFYGGENFKNVSSAFFVEKTVSRLTVTQQYTRNLSQYGSEFFTEKNYSFISHENQTDVKFAFQCGFLPEFVYLNKFKRADGNALKVFENSFSLTLSYENKEKGLVSVSSKYIFLNVKNSENQSVMYQFLEGMNGGGNFVLNFNSSYKISKHLLLNFEYELRKSETQKAVHTGGVELRVVL